MLRLVQHEIPTRPPVEEKKRPIAGPFDPLQELLRDDLVGIDIRAIQRRHPAGNLRDRIH